LSGSQTSQPTPHDDGLVAGSSVLFGHLRPEDGAVPPMPACFPDLMLDRVVASVVSGREEYRLSGYFFQPLHDVDAVVFRQEVMRDVDRDPVAEALETFAESMRSMRRHLGVRDHLYERYQQLRWFVDAVDVYTRAVRALSEDLTRVELWSRGLTSFRDHVRAYVASRGFLRLVEGSAAVARALGEIEYEVTIRGLHVTVSPFGGEPDYSSEIQRTFARFQQGVDKDYRSTFSGGYEMSQVEGRILELVARLFPQPFAALDRFRAEHAHYLDRTIAMFDREIQFYLAYRRFIERIRSNGLPFCYPRVSASSKAVRVDEGFDVALADRLVPGGGPVVTNDFALDGPERVLVVTGPNQGGKTTFARMFGQLHYLASLGLPVPGRDARLFVADRVFTHFEREEDITTLRGKLEDELYRSREILGRATAASVLVMNEGLTATSLSDALYLGSEMLARIIELGALCVWVTFVDELSALGESTVSMVAEVDPVDVTSRTFKVVRRPADGRAYADALADRHGLTYDAIRERVLR
jgi:DNA mismatch repair protein MutS